MKLVHFSLKMDPGSPKILQNPQKSQRIIENPKESHKIRRFQLENGSRISKDPSKSTKIPKNPIKSGNFSLKMYPASLRILQNPQKSQRISKNPINSGDSSMKMDPGSLRILQNPKESQRIPSNLTISAWKLIQDLFRIQKNPKEILIKWIINELNPDFQKIKSTPPMFASAVSDTSLKSSQLIQTDSLTRTSTHWLASIRNN